MVFLTWPATETPRCEEQNGSNGLIIRWQLPEGEEEREKFSADVVEAFPVLASHQLARRRRKKKKGVSDARVKEPLQYLVLNHT